MRESPVVQLMLQVLVMLSLLSLLLNHQLCLITVTTCGAYSKLAGGPGMIMLSPFWRLSVLDKSHNQVNARQRF